MKRFAIIAAALLLATAARAHGPSKGANGGPLVDVGDYHVEMVAKDTTLSVHLSDDKNQPIDANGHRAAGLFVVTGKPQGIELRPESANKLTGTSAAPLPPNLKGAIQITLPTGKTVQAKFQ